MNATVQCLKTIPELTEGLGRCVILLLKVKSIYMELTVCRYKINLLKIEWLLWVLQVKNFRINSVSLHYTSQL